MGGWAYMLECSDGSLYVGSTSYDKVEMRVSEHNNCRYWGFTWARRPVKLAWAQWFDDLRDAHIRERQIKGWSRAKKQALIAGDAAKLVTLAKRRGGHSAQGTGLGSVKATGTRLR